MKGLHQPGTAQHSLASAAQSLAQLASQVSADYGGHAGLGDLHQAIAAMDDLLLRS